MRIVVNGEARDAADGLTLVRLVETLGAPPARVATVVNGDLVRAPNRAARRLQDGDRVDVLAFAPGG